MSIIVKKVDPRESNIQALIDGLEKYNRQLYPEFFASRLSDYTIEELCRDNFHFIAGFIDEFPVGIGAVKYVKEENYAEITRVFVHEDYRRKGIAIKMIQDLENQAQKKGFSVFKLETGIGQPEAIKLYEKLGYVKTEEGFGHHTNANHNTLYFMPKNIK